MGMDSSDFQLVKEISELQKKMLDELKKSRQASEKSAEQQVKLLEIFGKVAAGLNDLATEVAKLREDLGPKKLDKPTSQFPLKTEGNNP